MLQFGDFMIAGITNVKPLKHPAVPTHAELRRSKLVKQRTHRKSKVGAGLQKNLDEHK